MKHLKVLFLFVALPCLLMPVMLASNIDLYDFAISSSTGIKADWQDASSTDPTTLVMSTMVCCGDASGGTTPGLGTLNYAFTGGPGTYTVTMYFNYNASTPFFNEYGTVNNAGSVQSGISYEIFNVLSKTGNIVLYPATGVAGSETFGTANGSNGVPGTTDNFLGTCSAASCNGDVGLALTYNFTLGANQEAILTAISSTSNPGGFSLETTHPVDANNTTASNVFLTGSFAIVPTTGPSIPEPATWALVGSGLVLLGVACVRGKSRAS